MGNYCFHGRSSKDAVNRYEEMSVSRLFALLFVISGYTKPARGVPLRPVCDPRVMDRFIKEARDAENAVKEREEACALPEDLQLPVTNVNVMEWDAEDSRTKEEEVQAGLSLLSQAMLAAHGHVTSRATRQHLETVHSNLRSIAQILKSLNMQEIGSSDSQPRRTFAVKSVDELLRVHTNFLRGKVKLLLSAAEACRPERS
ncbi:erythropoietin-like isoform X2 [Acipenser oxyrinchus oxyrinchus]|uniref:Erythropoietin n=1 Tax=Acipenser oxyrinchus oxyrinchus TaxID=40147 RepID=A0AAD8FTQ0_ACIOX|nr:erythropoietin-like isoform X2 [Acipenser oxyrinchus oxyrinchus]